MNNKPAIFSFFSGIGFLDLGFEHAGCSIELVNEYRSSFLEAYIHARGLSGNEPTFGYHNCSVEDFIYKKSDLKQWVKNARQRTGSVGFIGGPPCPDFSVGGKNRGGTGVNGRLSGVYIDMIVDAKPDFFLFENVRGLLRTKQHRKFYDEMKADLREAGYYLTDKLINATEFGAPQDRDRIILLGFHRNLAEELGLPHDDKEMSIPTKEFPWQSQMEYPFRSAFQFLWPTVAPFQQDSLSTPPEDIPTNLTVKYWFERNKVEQHPNSQHHFKPHNGLARFLTVDEGDDSRKSYKRLHRWRYSPTVAYGNNEVHLHPYKPRRISAAEALALQSLPANFVLPDSMTLTDMFKSIGNGVPYLVSKCIANSLVSFINPT